MANINFRVRGKKKNSYIQLRLYESNKVDLTVSTTLTVVSPQNWLVNDPSVKNKKQAIRICLEEPNARVNNDHLERLKSHIITCFNRDYTAGVDITKDWLKQEIEVYFGKVSQERQNKKYLIPFIESFILDARNRYTQKKDKAARPVTHVTIQKYRTVLRRLKEFSGARNYRLTEIDMNFYREYLSFLRKQCSYNENTVGKHVSTLKTFLHDAEIRGYEVSRQFRHHQFKSPTAKTKDIYLTEEEINRIYNYDLSDNDRLDNIRDLFIIGLRTGLRISDFMRLREAKIENGFIEIEAYKTAQSIIIPMHPQVKQIIEKRQGLPKKMSEVGFNKHIKTICKLAGITQEVEGAKINEQTKRKETGVFPKYQLVSSHICRRSFATNLYGKIPNMTIMGITGHTTESNFLKYLKITKTEHAEKLQEFWLQQAQQSKF